MKCIVCDSLSWTYLFSGKDRMFGFPRVFREYRCNNCDLVRLDPKLSLKELQKYYPSKNYYSYSQSNKPSFFGLLRSYLISRLYSPTILSRFIEIFVRVPAMPEGIRPGKILDIGCGSGDTLALLKTVGWDTYGLDIDAQAIKVAYNRGLHNVSLGTYKDLTKYPDNFFDVIRLYHVVEHLDDPEMCYRLIYKKLKKGGQIIIGTPNANSFVARIFRQYWYNLDAPRHLYLFSPKTLTSLVERSKFRRTKIEFCSAGGWVGSIQYILEQQLAKDIDLINRQWLVVLFYPLEWLLDKMRCGDVFVLRARKS